jgi:hydroxyacylglutathione hydrolase
VLDVRTVAEWSAGHVPGATNIPLGELQARMGELSGDRPLVVHCQAGGRAAIAASVLNAHGVTDLRLYAGGYTEWIAAGHPTASGAD